jgi:hypothetical protein
MSIADLEVVLRSKLVTDGKQQPSNKRDDRNYPDKQ